MIQNSFSVIILKRKELRPLFKIFIKHFQQQIGFIEQIIEEDVDEMEKEANCCYYIIRKINCFKKKVGSRFEPLNQAFYKVFREMSSTQRQDYFLELLNFIQVLGKAYQEYLQKHYNKEDFKLSKYKTHITTILFQKIVNKDIVKQIETQQQDHVCLELMVKVDGKDSYKVGRFKNLKFQLIQKVDGIQTKICFNMKNYLPIDVDSEGLTVRLKALYQTIEPKDIELCFKGNYSSKKYDKYMKIFTELIKIGKIQKLVRSIDYIKAFGKHACDQNKEIIKDNLFMSSFVKHNSEQDFSDHGKIYIDSEEIIKSSVHLKKRFERLETIKKNCYQQVKRKLIETLNILAIKKEKQTEKLKEFLKKQSIQVPKPKSQAVIQALKSTQAFIPRKTSKSIVENVSKDILKRFAADTQSLNEKLSIIYQKKSLKQIGIPQHKDSFIESSQNKSITSQKFQKVFQIQTSKQIWLEQSHQNIYVRLYPQQYVFAQVEFFIDMIKIPFKPIYIVPDQALLKQSNNLSGDKLAEFKISWLDKIQNTIKLYCKKKNPNFIKIFIKLPIQLKSLVQAILNVQNYPKWHPNIKNVKIISIISSQNMIKYRMDFLNPVTNKMVTIQMIAHLFKFEGKYYIIQKMLQNNESMNKNYKSKGWLNFFTKQSSSVTKINFLMIRISNVNKNGSCEMVTTIDYDPIELKNSENAKKQINTFFSNYVFIANYWKQSEQEKKFNPFLFDYDWVVSKNSFEEKQQNLLKNVLLDHLNRFMNQQPRIIQKKQQEGNIQSSSELMQSSQYYDL